MVCEGMKKAPVVQPGGSARAIDIFRDDYIADCEWNQALKSAKNFLEHTYGKECAEGYREGFLTVIAYLAGYAANMPLEVAFDGASKILHERYGLEDE